LYHPYNENADEPLHVVYKGGFEDGGLGVVGMTKWFYYVANVSWKTLPFRGTMRQNNGHMCAFVSRLSPDEVRHFTTDFLLLGDEDSGVSFGTIPQ
jgi:hypothetical protein